MVGGIERNYMKNTRFRGYFGANKVSESETLPEKIGMGQRIGVIHFLRVSCFVCSVWGALPKNQFRFLGNVPQTPNTKYETPSLVFFVDFPFGQGYHHVFVEHTEGSHGAFAGQLFGAFFVKIVGGAHFSAVDEHGDSWCAEQVFGGRCR